jgi:hypothetical protein
MGGVNWQLGLSPDVGGSAYNAFLKGQEMGQADRASNALAAYAVDPNDQNLNALAPHNPQFVIGQKQAQAKAQQDQQAENDRKAHEQLVTVSRLFDGVQDEQTYQQRLGIAHRMGLDLTDAPPNFDPGWVHETGQIFKFFADTPQAMSTIGKQAVDEGFKPGTPEFNNRVMELGKQQAIRVFTPQPGAGAMSYDTSTGQMKVLVQPNASTAAMGTPVQQPNIPDAAIQELRSNPASAAQFDEIFGQGAAQRALGGAGSNASGGFRPVANGKAVIQQMFPGATVTSSYRPTGTKLAGGQTHDKSWHTQSHAAVDVAPIKGLTFDQYVAKVKAAGYPIIEARDEVTNPSKWSTGPHWHIVIGER